MSVTTYEEDEIIEETWRNDEGLHREGGPAFRSWLHGNLVFEEYWQNGKRHRREGPAFVRYEEGEPIQRSWWREGECHRRDGPAILEWQGDEFIERWCLDGRFVEENAVRRPQKYAAALRPLPIPIRDAIWEHFSRC